MLALLFLHLQLFLHLFIRFSECGTLPTILSAIIRVQLFISGLSRYSLDFAGAVWVCTHIDSPENYSRINTLLPA